MSTRDTVNRPAKFHMEIQGSLLQALGVNLYSSIAKCLVEFAANAYDSDATTFNVQMPFKEIATARQQIREAHLRQARQKVSRVAKKPVLLSELLPSGLTIVIEDNGHGMSPQDIQSKFLPVNRNRRANSEGKETPASSKTESGKRFAMGRKGLGKLAAFGVAEEVTIYSKRKGETFATQFTMEYQAIAKAKGVHTVPFTTTYFDGLPKAQHFTKITLRSLRFDAVSANENNISSNLTSNFFGIPESEFRITINGAKITPEDVKYEFIFPSGTASGPLTSRKIILSDKMGELDVKLKAMFRAPEGGKRIHLSSEKRGARIYCNGRMAAGPTLADLHSGVHNFVATAYLEVIVQADVLDSLGIDIINTNRTDFRRDNEIVARFLEDLTLFMGDALKAHSKFKDDKADKDLKKSKIGQEIEKQIEQLPTKTRRSTRKLVQLLARIQGPESEEFRETAPIILGSVNTGNVLVKLLEMSTSESELKEIILELNKLASIEQSDALKLFRARKNGIIAIKKLMDKAGWENKPNCEKDLHKLLEENPWLIDDSYGRYITSNQQLDTNLKTIEKRLQINRFSKPDPKKPIDETKRPDLVFLLGDSISLASIIIVELKAPKVPLNNDHYEQLFGYITSVENHVGQQFSNGIRVTGLLIGKAPDRNSRQPAEAALLKKWKEFGPNSQIKIVTLTDLFSRAAETNAEMLRILEKEDR